MSRERLSPVRLAAILAVAAVQPHKGLLAAAINVALADARAGDAEAAVWLRGDTCRSFLAFIAPDGTDPDALHGQLLALVPAASGAQGAREEAA